WQLGVAQAVEVVAGLGVGAVQVLAAGLVLDQQHALPEQVDVAVLAIELLDPLLETGDALAADAEDLEELVPEGLGLGILRGHVGPFPREAQVPVLDLVPAQWHGGCPVWRWKDWLSIPTPVSAGATVAGKARPQAPVGARLHKAGGQQPTQITLPGLFGQAGVHALVPGFQPQRRRRQGAAAVHQVPDDRVLARIDLPRLQLPS